MHIAYKKKIIILIYSINKLQRSLTLETRKHICNTKRTNISVVKT